ncbi:OmpA family protein [Hyalangium versicolor]|uniref:OmpA family protein n=1 Tax=Hyalangium versicolor TaxID=2861190 RepID=UPI001CCF3C92|nr:OmpA family protein [Hyalangium versicolor]
MASTSISALLERNTELEQGTLESEARVAELQVLRASMERRLRQLDQQQTGTTAQRESEARKIREADVQAAQREAARVKLEARLKNELAQGDIWFDTTRPDALRVELSERLLFEPGQSSLTAQGVEELGRIGAVLAAVEGHAVEVSSHTDDLPAASGTGVGTSWELSSARATAIVRVLMEPPARIVPERLSAIGHASFRPEVPMDSPQNRQRNRRVELTLSPMPVPPASLLATLEPTPPPLVPVKAASGGKSSKKSGRR